MAIKGLKSDKIFINFFFMFIILFTCKGFELELLLSTKASINDPFQSLIHWNSSLHFCTWNGITCLDSSHVSKIELPGKNLSGKIPDSIFRFPYIQSIDLSENQFFGEIPSDFASCFSLRYLNLSNNNLTGFIPIGHLPFLEKLDLSNNFISGQIPREIGLFSGLKVLDFGGNVLTGKIPVSITNLTSLEFITLASNQMSGEIPGELGLMKNLKWIYLGYNNFSGKIPKEIGELTSLYHLNLVYNNLTGEIPSSLGNLTNLEYLFLYFNKLNGPIPKTIFNLKKLVSLDLSDNSLSGDISELFGQMNNLQILHLFSNEFSGKIPSALSSLPHLQVLQLWSNRLSGEIPEDLGKYNNLTVLDLSTNNLTGKIPRNLCSSGRLFKLILFSNALEGEIPGSLSHCMSLQRIRIQQNRLSGEISSEFTKLPMVYYLDLSENNLYGRIDDRKWDMPQLQMLNLAKNGFFGHLPGSFGSKNLENLDLSMNNFSGKIPQSFGEFSQLVELKLSENQLSGRIPNNLSYCKKLVSLDLSHNHLFGEIPVSFGEMPVLSQLDLSENELTGKIPSNLGKVESLVQVNISHNHFYGNLPSTGAFLAINSTSVIGNKLCGNEKTSGLPSCDGVNHVRWIVLTFLLASLIVFASIVFITMFVRRRKLGLFEVKKIESSEDGTWEMQFMNSKFSRFINIKDILASIREENMISNGSYIGKSSSSNMKFVAKEIATIGTSNLCKFNHPNIVKLLAICRSKKAAILVYEYIEGDDLSEIIRGLNWNNRLKIAINIAKALKYLHGFCSPSFIVGDISTWKIMVDEKNEAHLRLSFPGINVDNKCFNSSAYVAPEMKEPSKGFTEKSDIYGFGVFLIELLTGKSRVETELGIHESLVEWARYCYSECHIEMWIDSTINDNHDLNNYRNQIVETMNLALRCTADDPTVRPCAIDLSKNLESIVKSSSNCVFLGFKLFSSV